MLQPVKSPPDGNGASRSWSLELLLENGATATFSISNETRLRVQARLADKTNAGRSTEFTAFESGRTRLALNLKQLVHATLEPVREAERGGAQWIGRGVIRVWLLSLPEPVDLRLALSKMAQEEPADGDPEWASPKDYMNLDGIFRTEEEKADGLMPPSDDAFGVRYVREEMVALMQVARSTLQIGAQPSERDVQAPVSRGA
jgi:hypothetical protein